MKSSLEHTDDLQIVVTDNFDLLSFETEHELVFVFTRAEREEVEARVSEVCHELGRAAAVRCSVSDALLCGRLSDVRFLNIPEWKPAKPDVSFRSDDIIILVGRSWGEEDETVFRLLFGVAEIEVVMKVAAKKPAEHTEAAGVM